MTNPNVGYATLTVIPSLRGIEASIKQQSGAPMANAGRAAGTNYSRAFGDTASKGILSTQTKLAGLAIGGVLVKRAVGDASDLSESVSKSRVVFGSLSGEVERFGDTSAKSLGISKQQAIEAASTFGNLFTAMKIGQAPAKNMSLGLVKLASDLASFNNTRPEDALAALRSGLSGEIEPLRAYGVNLTEVTLKAKAMELGLFSGKGAIDAGAKAQAAYALILEQTTTAQGDFARTADGLANKQRTAAAQAEDTGAKIGNSLVPATKAATSVATAFATVIGAQPGALIQAEVAAVALGLGYAKIVKPIGEAITASRSLAVSRGLTTAAAQAEAVSLGTLAGAELAEAQAATTTTVANTKLAGSFRLAGTAAPFLAAALGGVLLDRFAQNKAAAKEYAASLVSDSDSPAKALNTLVMALDEAKARASKGSLNAFNPDDSKVFITWDSGAREAATRARELNSEVKALRSQIIETGTASEIMALKGVPAFVKMAAAAKATAVATAAIKAADPSTSIQAWHQANRDTLNSVSATIAKNTEFTQSTQTLKDAIQAVADNEKDAAGTSFRADVIRAQAAQAAKDDATAYRAAVDQLTAAQRSEAAAERGVADAAHGQEEALRGVAAAQRGVEEAQRSQADAVRGLASAQKQLADAEAHSVDLVKDLAKAYDDAKVSLREMNEQAAGDKLGVLGAKFALADAIEAQRQGPDPSNSDPNAQGKLDLAVAEAQARYADAQEAAAESAQKLNEANAAGLDQSPEVLAAQGAIADNNSAIADGHNAVADATQAVSDANVGLEEANHAVSEAQRGVATADQAYIDAKQAVIDAHTQVATATASVGEAAKKAKDDQITAALEIFNMQGEAKLRSAALRGDVVTDFGLMLDAARNYGLGLSGVNDWLKNLENGLAPDSPLRREIDALLSQLQPNGQRPATVPTGATGNAGAGVGSGSGTVSLPTAIYNATGQVIGYRQPDGTVTAVVNQPTPRPNPGSDNFNTGGGTVVKSGRGARGSIYVAGDLVVRSPVDTRDDIEEWNRKILQDLPG